MEDLMERITVDPDQCGGEPCVRGFRVTVADVLKILAESLDPDDVVAREPLLETEDIQACLHYAAEQLGEA